MASLPFPALTVSGSPYDRGYQVGSRAKKLVLGCLDAYARIFKTYVYLEWSEAVKRAEKYTDAIARYDPQIMEEMKGIADGCGRPPEEIVALNARSEIALTRAALDGGCTSLAICPQRTEGPTYLAQNWDWKQESLLLLRIEQPPRPTITMVTEAGIVGKIGFNSAGLGVCLNALASEQSEAGVPIHVILRGILDSANLGDAIEAVARTQVASSACFFTAHSDGEAAAIEVAPNDFDVILSRAGLNAHTNHFLSLRLAAKVTDLGKRMFPDTFVRQNRAENLLARHAGPFRLADVQAILRDHLNYPDSICRHPDAKDPEGRRLWTVFSIAMDLTARQMWLCRGQPCQNEYVGPIADLG